LRRVEKSGEEVKRVESWEEMKDFESFEKSCKN